MEERTRNLLDPEKIPVEIPQIKSGLLLMTGKRTNKKVYTSNSIFSVYPFNIRSKVLRFRFGVGFLSAGFDIGRSGEREMGHQRWREQSARGYSLRAPKLCISETMRNMYIVSTIQISHAFRASS